MKRILMNTPNKGNHQKLIRRWKRKAQELRRMHRKAPRVDCRDYYEANIWSAAAVELERASG